MRSIALFGAFGVNNFGNYSSAEVDRLFNEAKVEMDDGKRLALLKQIQDTLQNDLAWIPLVETKTEWAFSNKLTGVTWHPENSIHFIDLGLQKLVRLTPSRRTPLYNGALECRLYEFRMVTGSMRRS